MLYITHGQQGTKSPMYPKGYQETKWHVNEPLPSVDIYTVVEVQADGDELVHVIESSTGLPIAKGRNVQVWFGDHAKFIVHNLLGWLK